jgi:hypothetical protein
MQSDEDGLSGLSLSDAQRRGRIDEFITLEEARGVGPIDRAEFDAGTSKLIKAPQSEGQTSHSASGGNSSGKKTRRGSGQGASD